MGNSGGIVFYRADVTGDEKNCVYPVEVCIRNKRELAEALSYDHVFVKFRDNRRSVENFEYAALL